MEKASECKKKEESNERCSSLFLSNQIEILSENLFDALLFSSHPFERRIVVVPDESLKTYLFHRMANDPRRGVAAGFESMGLMQAINELLALKDEKQNRHIPSQIELSLKLEHEIVSIIEKRQDKDLFLPLYNYLGVDDTLSIKGQSRLKGFCDQLSRLFIQYGLFGGEFLKEWKELKGWQQHLWKKIFFQSELTFPYQALDAKINIDFSLHIFGFSFLPKLYTRFFSKLGCNFYTLSPCQLFWGDICSEKERFRYQKFYKNIDEIKREELDGYLKDRNPLLANLGKLGREFFTFLDDETLIPYEQYEEINEPPRSTLKFLQEDLLTLYTPDGVNIRQMPKDDSVQLHTVTTKLREVEALLNFIQGILSKKEDSLFPKDIMVLAPDISFYVPYIHMVFGSKECHLDYSISDLSFETNSSLAQGLEHLLSLTTSRFEVSSVLKLFGFNNFLEKFGLSIEDANLIRRFISKANIRWGLNPEYCQSVLSTLGEENLAVGPTFQSWQEGLDRLLYGLAMFQEEELSQGDAIVTPMPFVELLEAEVLGKLMHIVESLKEDLKPLFSSIKLSPKAWMSYFKALSHSYFVQSVEDKSLIDEFDRLSQNLKELEGDIFSYESIYRALDGFFKKKNGSHKSSSLQKISFCSIHAESIIPAEAICLLGMEEGTFPRASTKFSLCEMSSSKIADYCPTSADQDRYRFLELLLSARRYFYISYNRLSLQDMKEQGPSLVVLELLSYLNQSFCGEEDNLPSSAITHVHPALCFDKSYFSVSSYPKSWSPSQFLAAKAYLEKARSNPLPFFSEFANGVAFENIKKEKEITLDIKHLFKLTKHPIALYFNYTLGVYLKGDEEKEEAQEFLLSSLDKYHFRRASLKAPLENVLKAAQKSGTLPVAAFKEVACKRVEDEMEEYSGHLTQFNIDPKDLCFIELKMGCHEMTISPQGTILLPPLRIALKNDRFACLTGKLSDISSQGLLFHGTKDLKDLIKAWPQFLVFLNLPSEIRKNDSLLFSKSGDCLKSNFLDPQALLSEFIDYFETAACHLSPLMPYCAPCLLKDKGEGLDKALQNALTSSNSHVDEYLEYLFLRPVYFSQDYINPWVSYLEKIFSPLLEWEKNL